MLRYANISILYPLKILENQRFPRVFRGYKIEIFIRNVLIRPGKLHESRNLFELFGWQLVIAMASCNKLNQKKNREVSKLHYLCL